MIPKLKAVYRGQAIDDQEPKLTIYYIFDIFSFLKLL
jgi:hypothetical protein